MAGTCFLVGSASATSAAATAPAGWVVSQGDAGYSNHIAGETILTSSTVAGIKAAYTVKVVTPSTCDSSEFGERPLATATTLISYDHNALVGTKLATGANLWRTEPISGAGKPEAINDGVLVGSNVILGGQDCATGAPGFLAAYSISTGKVVWHLDNTTSIFRMVSSGSTVYDFGNTGKNLVIEARSAATGKVLWSHAKCGQTLQETLFVEGDALVTSCGGLSISKKGALKWPYPAKSQPDVFLGDPVGTANPQVYERSNADESVIALNAATGKIVWRNTGLGDLPEILAAGPARVYVACQGFFTICALNRSDGTLAWSTSVADNNFTALAADVAYVGGPGNGSNSGGTVALNATTGAPIPLSIGPLPQSSPAEISNGHVITVDNNTGSIQVYARP